MYVYANDNYKKNNNNKKKNQTVKLITNISKVIFSGIAGVFITIGYQHFFAQPQNQEQMQTQQQEQTQNQSIVLNINGKEISYELKDVENLNNQISLLESENKKLEETITILENQINQKEAISKMNLYDYPLYINGVEQNIITNNSVIEYNSYTYLRSDIVSLLDSSITINKENNEIVKGNDLGKTVSLMKECPPYEAYISYSTDPFIIQNKTYSKGFSAFCSDYKYLLFNLENKYSSLQFDIGHIDGSGDYGCVVNFYIDDEYIKTITKSSQDDISHEEIPLNYGKILKMEILTKEEPTASAMCASYGFANMVLIQ